MIQKCETKLALFGLSYIHDSRLNRLFHDGKVTMKRPEEDPDSWFNLMVVHQNRADRGPKNYLPDEILPSFLDLVIWGHEHDCHIEPEPNKTNNFYISQPGSSVATSLAAGEALQKHCGLLLINKNKFDMRPIKLETVRPFVFDSITLSDHTEEIDEGNGDKIQNIQAFVAKRIEEMIKKSESQINKNNPVQPKQPLIRLNIVFNDESQMFHGSRFGQQYSDRVANPNDIISFRKFKKRIKMDAIEFDKNALNDAYNKEAGDKDEIRVEDIVHRYFEDVDDANQLKVFSTESLSEMCRRIILKDDTDTPDKIVDFYYEKLCEHLKSNLPRDEDIKDEIANFKLTKSNDLFGPMLTVCLLSLLFFVFY